MLFTALTHAHCEPVLVLGHVLSLDHLPDDEPIAILCLFVEVGKVGVQLGSSIMQPVAAPARRRAASSP